jgi:SPP1 gp7 family putative phage head morphogenesis protein
MANSNLSIIAHEINRQKFFNKRFKLKKASKMFTGMMIENQYVSDIQKLIVNNLIDVTESHIIANLPSILSEAKINRPRIDDYTDMITSSIIKTRIGFSNLVSDEDIKRMSQDVASASSGFQRKQLTRVLASQIGANIFFDDFGLNNEIKGFIANNVQLIKTVPERHFARVESTVFNAARQGSLLKDVNKQIQNIYGQTKTNASRIARDQHNKLFGQLNQFRQLGVGIARYIWRTVEDNRVRPTHSFNNGKSFLWSRPPLATGHPGQDFQCRCWAEPDLSEFF